METLILKGEKNKNCKIFTNNVEQEAMSIIYNILNQRVFENSPIRIMPDVHAGKGITIGFSAPLTNMVCPSHVGVDIGCMIDTYILNKSVNSDEYAIIEHRIRKEVPFGFETNDKRAFEMKDFIKFLKSGYNKARSSWPEMVESVSISEKYISEMLKRIGMEEGVFYKSIGSVGGGNHFIEIGETPEGNYAVTIHCGSRNFGVKVCKYWEKIASSNQINKKEMNEAIAKAKASLSDKTKMPKIIEEIKESFYAKSAPNGYLSGKNMIGYISDMVIAQLYAEYNHKVIADKILSIFYKVNQAKLVEHITSVHNYIDMSDHIIRKGAIRSYSGEKMVIPFNMRDGLAICEGKSNSDWNFSAPHGAGRLMSRSKARAELSVDEFKEQMCGVYSTSVGRSTIDEAPNAYKPMDEILDCISDTCDVLYMIKPVINLKSTDEINE